MERDGDFLLLPSALLTCGHPDLDKWELMAEKLCSYQRSLYWWIGDIVVFGEAQMGDDIYQCFGPGMSSGLIDRCAKVSRAFAASERFPELSWSQHQLVSNMDTRQDILNLSLCEGWDTDQLRAYLKEIKS